MSDGDETGTWYVRARGRVLGPLTWAQLESLRDCGRLARFDEISRDRQNWTAADRVARLYPRSGTGNSPPESAGAIDFLMLDDDDAGFDSPAAVSAFDEGPEWYFARGAVQQGPVRISELQRMADTGEIDPETLLWKNGMEQWTPGAQVAELRFPVDRGERSAPRSDVDASDTTATADPGKRTSVLAISSLIVAIFWMFGLGSLSAIVLSLMSLRQIARSQGTLRGKGLAHAGMVVGILGLVLAIAFIGLILKDR